jgi:hypothetical protein
MEHGLAQIAVTPQVGGAFVCDNRGDVIASSSPAALATVTMNAVGREVSRIFAAIESAGHAAGRLDFTFTNWRLLAIDMNEALLFVVCYSHVDMAFARMTADVVLTGWRTDPEVQRRLERHRSERSQVVNSTSFDRPAFVSWRASGAGSH